tara:strand:- start:1411 stop:2682 length:1272 start_codon:yes stop_codon:yes gene_type:complete
MLQFLPSSHKRIAVKSYLVGGAVRDKLLNLMVEEQDWVVVGSTPQAMQALGFQQVGHDFPVYLHPRTKEEYALARTERKSAPGYQGFECDANPDVTLEEDLKRRDLTINAMAMDEHGQLIDPYGGLTDLNARVLRHVSDAFVEDPLRVLRVARFAARFHYLGFSVAPKTNALMYQMVKQGELTYLTPERVWQELAKSLATSNPEIFITTLRLCGALEVILPEVNKLFGVPASAKYHPEIDTGVHTLQVLQATALLTLDVTCRFAALVHDVGKAQTNMQDWPKHPGHGELGVPLITALCQRLRVPTRFQRLAILVASFHLDIHRVLELEVARIVYVLEHTDALRQGELFEQLLLVSEADARGGSLSKAEDYQQRSIWQALQRECAKLSGKLISEQGFEGIDIKTELTKRREACVTLALTQWKKI